MSDAALLSLRASGWIAALLLLAALAATPVAQLAPARWSPRVKLVALRRVFGIVAATLTLAHALVALTVYLPPEPWQAFVEVTWLRSGALATALLVPLLLTSFPPVVRALRVAAWKPLHRLAYVAAALVVHHLLLAPFAPRAWVLVLASAFGVSLLARLRLPKGQRPQE